MLCSWRAAAHDTLPRTQAVAAASASAIPRLPSPAEQAAEIARLERELDRTVRNARFYTGPTNW